MGIDNAIRYTLQKKVDAVLHKHKLSHILIIVFALLVMLVPLGIHFVRYDLFPGDMIGVSFNELIRSKHQKEVRKILNNNPKDYKFIMAHKKQGAWDVSDLQGGGVYYKAYVVAKYGGHAVGIWAALDHRRSTYLKPVFYILKTEVYYDKHS